MPKRVLPEKDLCRGSSVHSDDSSPSSALRLLLSLEMPTCCICGEESSDADNCSGPLALLPMPPCQCRTTLASPGEGVRDTPIPPVPKEGASSVSLSAYLDKLFASPFFSSKQPKTKDWHQNPICYSCLEQWSKSSNDVERYDYRDENEGMPGFSVDVNCSLCKKNFSKRSIDRLITGGRIGRNGGKSQQGHPLEWEDSLERTEQVVRWGREFRRWAVHVLKCLKTSTPACNGNNNDVSRTDPKIVLQSILDECGGDIQNDEAVGEGWGGESTIPAASVPHRQLAQPGELYEELAKRDPKVRQEQENYRLLREKMKTREGLAELGLDGRGDEANRAEEEKKSEEIARALSRKIEEEAEQERRSQEKEDAAIAIQIQEQEEKEQRKKILQSNSQSSVEEGFKRKSPFDSSSRNNVASSVSVVASISNHKGDRADCVIDDELKMPPRRKMLAPSASTRDNSAIDVLSADDCADADNNSTDSELECQVLQPQAAMANRASLSSNISSTPLSSVAPLTKKIRVSPQDNNFNIPINSVGFLSPRNDDDLVQLNQMGFDQDQARQAYFDSGKNLELAITILLSATATQLN